MKLAVKTLFKELPIHAPIRELRAKEVDARKVAADIVVEITVKDMPLSFASICSIRSTHTFLQWFSYPITVV